MPRFKPFNFIKPPAFAHETAAFVLSVAATLVLSIAIWVPSAYAAAPAC